MQLILICYYDLKLPMTPPFPFSIGKEFIRLTWGKESECNFHRGEGSIHTPEQTEKERTATKSES